MPTTQDSEEDWHRNYKMLMRPKSSDNQLLLLENMYNTHRSGILDAVIQEQALISFPFNNVSGVIPDVRSPSALIVCYSR